MNVLIFSASTGGGHNRASNALRSYIESADSTAHVDIVDILEYCSKLLNKTVTIGYKALAKKAPDIYGTFYKQSDKDSPISDIVKSVMVQMSKKLLPLLKEKQPDVIINCHPFASGMMSILKEAHGIDIPVITIITDYMPHKAYIGEHVDAFITASKQTSDELIHKYSIPASKVFSLGMPIYDSFYSKDESKAESTKNELGLRSGIPTVLIMAGSFGVTDILKIYERLVAIDVDYQIIVITGKNRRLYEAFEKLLNNDITEFETIEYPEPLTDYHAKVFDCMPDNLRNDFYKSNRKMFKRSTNKTKPTRLFYFVDNVEDYMHISDLIITKPGGLTTCESLACGLPMAVFKAFPGQESQNADVLVNQHAAIVLEKGETGASQIEFLLTHPEELKLMSKNCKKFSRPNSTENIYHLMLDIISCHNKNMNTQ